MERRACFKETDQGQVSVTCPEPPLLMLLPWKPTPRSPVMCSAFSQEAEATTLILTPLY